MWKVSFLAAALLLASGPALSEDPRNPAARAKEAKPAPRAEAQQGEYWSREQIARRAEARMRRVVKALEEAVGRARAAF